MSLSPDRAREVVLAKSSRAVETHPLFLRIQSLLAPYEASIAEARRQAPGPPPPTSARSPTTPGHRCGGEQRHVTAAATAAPWRSRNPPSQPHSGVGGGGGGRRRGGGRHRREPPSSCVALPPPSTRLKPKTDESFYVGALNRINRSNYRRVQADVMESLRKTEGDDMWLRVLDLTLLQSCIQAFFVDHHINLVRDMLKTCDRDVLHEQLGRRMRERVDAFVAKFLDETLPKVVTNVAGTVLMDADDDGDKEKRRPPPSDDDLFCRYVKHKAHLSGANKAVLRLEHEKPQKLLEYARRIGECIPLAVDHASLLMLLEFVMEFVSRVKSAPGRGEAQACFDKAQTRYEDFGCDHPQSRFKLQDVRRALSQQ